MTDYAVACIRPWNIAAFHKFIATLPGRWHLFDSRETLTNEAIKRISPRYLFITHWSWRIPVEIYSETECVLFHMTDLPFGRGGSPLQNMILAGLTETQLSAIKVTDEIDAGPIYLKRPMSLAGRAQDIFERAADLAFEMIDDIVRAEPVPQMQSGKITTFNRRQPRESELPMNCTSQGLFDHIRMLDADGYPHAFLEHGGFRVEFTHPELKNGEITAHVTIQPRPNRHD
jgi:methionyl-tRNA formyltransferase